MKGLALALLLVSATSAAQPLFKCRNADGTTSYQQEPCLGDQAAMQAPRIMAAPTLTAEERARIFGETNPDVEFDEQGRAVVAGSEPRPGRDHGLGTSAYGRGDIRGYQCTRPNGSVYFSRDGCGTSVEQQGMRPGRIVYDAVDPRTGETLATGQAGQTVVNDRYGRTWKPGDVQWRQRTEQVPRYEVARDHAIEINVDDACLGARRAAEQVRSRGGDYRQRSRADDRVVDLCQQGRSLYEPSPTLQNNR